MRKRLAVAVVGMCLLAAIPALAHHSFTSFWYMDKNVTIEGVVTELKLVNPHPTMKVEVTENGQKNIWVITARATASAILKAGWSAETTPIGVRVRIEGNPSRREGAKALAAGKIIRLSDNKELSFGGVGGIPQG